MEENSFIQSILGVKQAELEKKKALEKAQKDAESIAKKTFEKINTAAEKNVSEAKTLKEKIIGEERKKTGAERKKILENAERETKKIKEIKIDSKQVKEIAEWLVKACLGQ